MAFKKFWNNLFKIFKRDSFFLGNRIDGFYSANSYNKNIYLSDLINNAISVSATELSKISIKSIVEYGGQLRIQNDDITRIFRNKPNPFQSTSDFISSVEWIRKKNCNCFIYPQYSEILTTSGSITKKFSGFFPLNPNAIWIGVNDSGDVVEIELRFNSGQTFLIPYSRLIHLKWRRAGNIFVGGDEKGQNNIYDVSRALDAMDKMIEGIPKSIEASSQIKGIYKATTVIDKKNLQNEIRNLENHLFDSKLGIVGTDLSGEFTPVSITPPKIEPGVLEFIKSIIQEKYGVSARILSGNFTAEEKSAFFEAVIEPFIVDFEQAFTSFCFSERELDFGHSVKCYYDRISMLSEEQKMQRAQFAVNTGNMSLNEINTKIFGIEPYEGGDIRLRSLNYVDTNIANTYQLNNAGAQPAEECDNE